MVLGASWGRVVLLENVERLACSCRGGCGVSSSTAVGRRLLSQTPHQLLIELDVGRIIRLLVLMVLMLLMLFIAMPIGLGLVLLRSSICIDRRLL
jgi:hypothetical protein